MIYNNHDDKNYAICNKSNLFSAIRQERYLRSPVTKAFSSEIVKLTLCNQQKTVRAGKTNTSQTRASKLPRSTKKTLKDSASEGRSEGEVCTTAGGGPSPHPPTPLPPSAPPQHQQKTKAIHSQIRDRWQ